MGSCRHPCHSHWRRPNGLCNWLQRLPGQPRHSTLLMTESPLLRALRQDKLYVAASFLFHIRWEFHFWFYGLNFVRLFIFVSSLMLFWFLSKAQYSCSCCRCYCLVWKQLGHCHTPRATEPFALRYTDTVCSYILIVLMIWLSLFTVQSKKCLATFFERKNDKSIVWITFRGSRKVYLRRIFDKGMKDFACSMLLELENQQVLEKRRGSGNTIHPSQPGYLNGEGFLAGVMAKPLISFCQSSYLCFYTINLTKCIKMPSRSCSMTAVG